MRPKVEDRRDLFPLQTRDELREDRREKTLASWVGVSEDDPEGGSSSITA
jgi:hypothetical protein